MGGWGGARGRGGMPAPLGAQHRNQCASLGRRKKALCTAALGAPPGRPPAPSPGARQRLQLPTLLGDGGELPGQVLVHLHLRHRLLCLLHLQAGVGVGVVGAIMCVCVPRNSRPPLPPPPSRVCVHSGGGWGARWQRDWRCCMMCRTSHRLPRGPTKCVAPMISTHAAASRACRPPAPPPGGACRLPASC